MNKFMKKLAYFLDKQGYFLLNISVISKNMVQNLIKFIESRCYMNKVILAGRLVRDPEVRYTQTGKAVDEFYVSC